MTREEFDLYLQIAEDLCSPDPLFFYNEFYVDALTLPLDAYERDSLNGWFPIKDAPRDGSPLILWYEITDWRRPGNSFRDIIKGWWFNGDWCIDAVVSDNKEPVSLSWHHSSIAEGRVVYYRRPYSAPLAPTRNIK